MKVACAGVHYVRREGDGEEIARLLASSTCLALANGDAIVAGDADGVRSVPRGAAAAEAQRAPAARLPFATVAQFEVPDVVHFDHTDYVIEVVARDPADEGVIERA